MTGFRILLLVFGLALVALIVWAMGADGRALGAVLAAMAGDPWTVVTLADLYLGFVIAAVVMMLAERRWWIGLFWAMPVFVLGNVWTALWLALRLPSLARRLRGVR